MSDEKTIVEGQVMTENTTENEETTRTEEFTISGEAVMEKVKSLIQEANVRRIILKTEEGKTLFELPVTIGAPVVALGAIFAPIPLAIAAVVALFIRVKLVVERVEK